MEDKFRLELLGITYNQIESGVYALILKQVGTNIRIPIIIGFPEAQAIECKLQEIKTPRPLTHDIAMAAFKEFGISLEYVLIKRLPNGVFAADLCLSDGITRKIVDSRSSDAVALALRADAPIYTTADVIREAGFDPAERKKGISSAPQIPTVKIKSVKTGSLETMSIEQLQQAMNKASLEEDYEEAARIKAEIDKRQNII